MTQPGTQFGGRYTVTSLIGHGGMGTVYQGRDERLGRDVALKVLREDFAADPGARQRFLREGQIAAQIVHPNVVRTYDAGDDPNGPFLVQELLNGKTLDQVLPLPPEHAAAIVRDIAAALSAIHEHGYVHCDVKPQNILLRPDGTPVLLDFGIARAEGMDATSLIATPHYLAPERATGAAPTAASDIYALGIVFFQTLTGAPPFDGQNIHQIIEHHINTEVPISGIAAPFDRVIARMTAKNPADRYPSAAAVQDDLRRLMQAPSASAPTIPIALHQAPPAPAQRPPITAPLQSTPQATMLPTGLLSGQLRWVIAALVLLVVIALGYRMAHSRRVAVPANAIPQENIPIAIQPTIKPTPTESAPVPTQPAPAATIQPVVLPVPSPTMQPDSPPAAPIVAPAAPADTKAGPDNGGPGNGQGGPGNGHGGPGPGNGHGKSGPGNGHEKPAKPEKPDKGHGKGKD